MNNLLFTYLLDGFITNDLPLGIKIIKRRLSSFLNNIVENKTSDTNNNKLTIKILHLIPRVCELLAVPDKHKTMKNIFDMENVLMY